MAEKRKYKHPQVNLRLPQELKEKLESVAELNSRSFNGQIVHELTQNHFPERFKEGAK